MNRGELKIVVAAGSGAACCTYAKHRKWLQHLCCVKDRDCHSMVFLAHCGGRQLPDDVYIDVLDGSHAELMNRNWPHRGPGSELIILDNINNVIGMGVFRVKDMKLISSAVVNYSGGIFVLHTEPEARGRGFATTLVKSIVQQIRTRGWIPFCTIILGNKSSEAVFRKIGFEQFCYVDYLIIRRD